MNLQKRNMDDKAFGGVDVRYAIPLQLKDCSTTNCKAIRVHEEPKALRRILAFL
jgi:hypothetical protein